MTSHFDNDYKTLILNELNMQDYLKYKIAYSNNNNKNNNNNNNKLKPVPNNMKNNMTNKNKLFIPKEQDTLFWCYFMISKGEVEYELLSNKNALTTKQMKIEYVSKIRENKSLLKIKTYKFDTLANIESNLANDTFINIKTMLSLCVIDNLNIIFLFNKCYYELLLNDDSGSYFVVHEMNNNSKYAKKYGFQTMTNEEVNEIRTNYYQVERIDKPFKSISSYKLPELHSIVMKLGLNDKNENNKAKNKTELYEDILQYFELKKN